MFAFEIDGKLKNHLQKGDEIVAILMYRSKVFDTTNQSLLLAKLDPYGFSLHL